LNEITFREAAQRGARELLPAAPGVVAWGIVTGVAMVKLGLTVPQAIGLSLLAYAGSAQLAALPLMISAAPLWLVLLTAVIVNLRFVVYSALTRPHFAHLSAQRRLWLGYIVGDIMFVKFASLLDREPEYPQRVAYYLGGALTNWVFWQVASIAGILAANWIPAQWGLELAGTLALIALIVPLAKMRPAFGGMLVAATIAVLAHALPMRLGLLLGILGGMAVALTLERRRAT
jgi:predicted branched-subunit amino acid permease